MAGPYPPYRPGGAEGQPLRGPAGYGAEPYPYPAGYPGPLPPPIGFSTPPGSRRVLWWSLLGVALAGVLVAAALAIGASRTSSGSAGFSDAASKAAIQNYLTALSDGDTETIARNNLCGMFDAVTDRKSDLAVARLSSDAFGKQFDRAEVTSIDRIVPTSDYQAQVLFTMRVAPARTTRNSREEEQGVAQLLRQGDQLLVCSYLLRTAGQF
ncbi:MAG: hypothetical protein WCJ98_11180 [Mycobacteriaceae bacterium]|jgi:hypothetical protein